MSTSRLQLKELVRTKVKRFKDDISKRRGKTNITEEWLYNRIKNLLLPGGFVACEACGMPMTWDSITIDHKIPRSHYRNYNGNVHNVDNLHLVDSGCNSLKGQKTLQEFLQQLHKHNTEINKLAEHYKNNPNPPVLAPLYPDIGLGQKIFGPDKSYKKVKKEG
jgi:5-methylcytosine-specific restriction endonuclease McrA